MRPGILSVGIVNGGHWIVPLRSFWPFWLKILGNSARPQDNSSQIWVRITNLLLLNPDHWNLHHTYYSFIYPYLTYCNHVWGLSCKSYMDALVKLQKRAVRIIAGVHPGTHTDPLFTNLKLLKCDEINKFLIGRLMYRIYIDDITLFNSMFIKNVQVHNYDTRQKDHYHLPCFKTRLGKISLRYNGVIVWNSILTCGIQVDVSQAVFSKTLKCSIIEGKL